MGQKALDLRYDPTTESLSLLKSTLFRVIEETSSPGSKWIFSTWGPLLERRNLSVLKFLGSYALEVQFALAETIKMEANFEMPFSELSFICSLEIVRDMFMSGELDCSWELSLCGWRVEDNVASSLLTQKKFADGFQLPSLEKALAFCSSDDWDCIQFFATGSNELERLSSANTR